MPHRSQILYISSANRIRGDIHDFHINFNSSALFKTTGTAGGRIKVSVLKASIIRSNYAVDDTTHAVYTVNADNEETRFELPHGNYDIVSFMAVLRAYLSLDVTFDIRTSRYTFKPTGDGEGAIRLRFYDNPVCLLFGFPVGTRDTAPFSAGTPLVSAIPVKMNIENSVVVHSSFKKERGAVMNNLGEVEFVESDVLVKVPVDVAAFDNIVFSGHADDVSFYLSSTRVQGDLRLWITDQTGRALKVQHDWTLTLRLDYYDGTQDTEVIRKTLQELRDYIKLMVLSDQKNLKA